MRETGIITTKYGEIRGVKGGDVIAWLGVPYAEPPVRELRWKSPQTLKGWKGVLDTVQFKNKAIQMVNAQIVGDEDCLYLNIWRPNSTERNLPVLVYVHGGGNLIGSGEEFKGDLIARNTNSIIISINYRLGLLGWFMHDCLKSGDPLNDSGNYGLLDIIKSLEWVQENIVAFGGDANNITLLGLSAGARNILAMMISPLAQGLFHKAIVLSGGMTLADPDQGTNSSNNILRQLVMKDGIANDAKQAQAWLNEQNRGTIRSYLMKKKASDFTPFIGKTALRMDPFPHLFKDGYVIPETGFELFRSGVYHKVPIIIGTTASEFAGFMVSDPFWGNLTTDETLFADPNKLQLFKNAVDFGSKLYSEFNLDRIARLLVNNKDQPEVFAYRFCWGLQEGVISPRLRLLMGASHGIDIDFITGDFAAGFMKTFYSMGDHFSEDNKKGRQDLSTKMMEYIKRFIYTSNPNGGGLPVWNPWEKDDPGSVLIFDGDKDKAIIEMTKKQLVREEIIDEMNMNLSEEDGDIIVEKLFNGRFFWWACNRT